MGIGPLTGVKVIDLTQFESGTVCTETLAWMGAEVWKVERPITGELGRSSVVKPGIDTYGFAILNMNKKSITCNLKSPEGVQLIYRLLTKADVIVENMGPGSIERLGLGYEKCKEINEKIIFASIKGFSKTSPYADYPAFDPIATHTGGFVSLTGTQEMPIKAGVSVADSGTGIACAMSISAALYQRAVQGIGQRIDIAMQDFIIGLCRSSWEPYYSSGEPPRRVGNGMPLEDVAPAGTYPCKPFGLNDYVHIYCSRAPGSRNFEDLCRIIGRPDLLADDRFATPQSRFVYKDILDDILTQWTRQRTKIEAMDILAKADIPAGAVLDIGDITNDPHYMDEGMIVEVDHRQLGKLKVPGFAPRMSENNIEYAPSPALGSSNKEIYHDILGLTNEELMMLQNNRVI